MLEKVEIERRLEERRGELRELHQDFAVVREVDADAARRVFVRILECQGRVKALKEVLGVE